MGDSLESELDLAVVTAVIGETMPAYEHHRLMIGKLT
jgi:hypothetical protein